MSQKLSIGIVTPTVSRAGGGIFPIVLAHASELTRAGHDVTVYGLDDDPEQLDRDQWKGLKLKLYQYEPFGFSRALTADLLRSRHDLLHQHALWTSLSFAVSNWRAKTGKPVVISTQGMLEPWALSNSAWKKRIAGALYEIRNVSRASAIHCSEAEVAGVRAFAPNSVVAVIPNGVELPDLSKTHLVPGDLFPSDRHMLLFFGRIHPKKGVAELLRAWQLLKKSRPDIASGWRLAVAGWGDGGHVKSLELLAHELGLSGDEVLFVGPRFGNDKANILANADAFILPSFSEGFPMAVLEAWSYALPVFMTRECNIPDGFTMNAAIEISNRPDAMAETLAGALSNADLEAIGVAGRELVERLYSWPLAVSKLSSVYQWVSGQGRQPSCVDVRSA